MNVEHRLIDVSFLKEVAWCSAPTSLEKFLVPRDSPGCDIGRGVPMAYVPLRNAIFAGLAAAFLESKVLHSLEIEGVNHEDVMAFLYMAPNVIDYSGYPDCRPEFMIAFRIRLTR